MDDIREDTNTRRQRQENDDRRVELEAAAVDEEVPFHIPRD